MFVKVYDKDEFKTRIINVARITSAVVCTTAETYDKGAKSRINLDTGETFLTDVAIEMLHEMFNETEK